MPKLTVETTFLKKKKNIVQLCILYLFVNLKYSLSLEIHIINLIISHKIYLNSLYKNEKKIYN